MICPACCAKAVIVLGAAAALSCSAREHSIESQGAEIRQHKDVVEFLRAVVEAQAPETLHQLSLVQGLRRRASGLSHEGKKAPGGRKRCV